VHRTFLVIQHKKNNDNLIVNNEGEYVCKKDWSGALWSASWPNHKFPGEPQGIAGGSMTLKLVNPCNNTRHVVTLSQHAGRALHVSIPRWYAGYVFIRKPPPTSIRKLYFSPPAIYLSSRAHFAFIFVSWICFALL
jgi:hypothetical protein